LDLFIHICFLWSFLSAITFLYSLPTDFIRGLAFCDSQRHLDLELVHMHFGVQAAVHALTCMQLLGASDGSKNEERQQRASFFLQQLHEHLEAISTPGRRVCLLDSTFLAIR
jgi:hypothetical protein